MMRYDINMSDEELKLERSMPAIDISYAQVDDGFIDKITTTDKKVIRVASDDDFILDAGKDDNVTSIDAYALKDETTKTTKITSVKYKKETKNNKDIKMDDKKQDKDIHKNHRKRVRSNFIKYGLEPLSEYQVLEMLLFYTIPRKDTNVIAHRLIDRFGTLNNVLEADYNDLVEVEDIAEVSASLIVFFRELHKYICTNSSTENTDLSTADRVGQFCCKYFFNHTEENLILISMDGNRKLKCVDVISRGSENETAFYPRKIIKAVVKNRTNVVAIAHNHPGGSPEPSSNDLLITKKLGTMLLDIGVSVIDHIICSGDKYVSIAKRGLLRF
ncbi:MAG: hypothetical protein IJN40_01855 [Clostridia bacterium]|nr:hypothetical protein [Clostridia bacterium]